MQSLHPPRPMRTLHLDTEFTWRGGQQQLRYLLEGLAARGIGATLLAQPGSPLVERARAAGIDAKPFASRGEVDLLAAWRLARLLRGERFDILHCHTAHAHGIGVAARWLTPRRRRPKLVVARRVLFGWNPSLPPSAQVGLSGFARWKYRQAGRIVAVSNAVKQGLVKNNARGAHQKPLRAQKVRVGHAMRHLQSLPLQAGPPIHKA